MSMIDRLKENLANLKARGYREWLNDNSVAVIGVSVVIMAVSVTMAFRQLNRPIGSLGPGSASFIDVVTRKEIIDKATSIPPLKSADGHEIVRVHYFSCSECTADKRFLGYYEKYTPEAKEILEKNFQSTDSMRIASVGRLYCGPELDPKDPKSWVGAETPEGRKITEAMIKKCPDTLRSCN